MVNSLEKQNKRGVKSSYISTIIGISLVLFMIGIVLGGFLGLDNIQKQAKESLQADLFFEIGNLKYKKLTSTDKAFTFLQKSKLSGTCELSKTENIVDNSSSVNAPVIYFPVSFSIECRLNLLKAQEIFEVKELLLSDLVNKSAEISDLRGGFVKISLHNDIINVEIFLQLLKLLLKLLILFEKAPKSGPLFCIAIKLLNLEKLATKFTIFAKERGANHEEQIYDASN